LYFLTECTIGHACCFVTLLDGSGRAPGGETMCLLAFLTGVSVGIVLLALVLWLLSS
jgi:hypothetical protein